MALTNPVEEAVGAGEPQGKAKTCQAVATVVLGFAGWVQLKIAEVAVTVLFVKVVGLLQVGAGAQVTLAIQPVCITLLSEVKTKVKQPFAALEVYVGGKVVPVYVPNKVPAVLFPSYILRLSQQLSIENEVKATVTKSPEVVGQIVVVIF